MNAPILNVSNLSKRFGGVRAVEDITFKVQPGELMGIIGPMVRARPPWST